MLGVRTLSWSLMLSKVERLSTSVWCANAIQAQNVFKADLKRSHKMAGSTTWKICKYFHLKASGEYAQQGGDLDLCICGSHQVELAAELINITQSSYESRHVSCQLLKTFEGQPNLIASPSSALFRTREASSADVFHHPGQSVCCVYDHKRNWGNLSEISFSSLGDTDCLPLTTAGMVRISLVYDQ